MPKQPSFIPKTVPSRAVKKTKRASIFLLIAGGLFLAVALMFAGVFLYERYLNQQIVEISEVLKKVSGEFEPPLIKELARTGASIETAKLLISQHTSLARLFKFLEENTLPSVRFLSFTYKDNEVDMRGQVLDYTALAQQTLLFEQSDFVENVSISNLSLVEGGRVGFTMRILFDPGLTVYQSP